MPTYFAAPIFPRQGVVAGFVLSAPDFSGTPAGAGSSISFAYQVADITVLGVVIHIATGYQHTVTIGGDTFSYVQQDLDTPSIVATALAIQINGSGDALATATAAGGTLTLAPRLNTGAAIWCTASDGNSGQNLFELTGNELIPQITKGVLFAQGVMYAPATAPVLGAAAASQQSWLFYNSSTGWYWKNAATPTVSDDAYAGWVATSATAVIAVSSRKIGTGAEAVEVPGGPTVVGIGTSGYDAGVPPALTFAAAETAAQLVLADVVFASAVNTDGVDLITFILYYVDETAPTALTLTAAMTSGATSLSASAPLPAAVPGSVTFTFHNTTVGLITIGPGYVHNIEIGAATYVYAQMVEDTAAQVATALANIVNAAADPNALATAVGATVVLTALQNTGAGVTCSASDGNTPATLTETMPSFVAIDQEIIGVQASNGSVVTRAQKASTAAAHASGAKIWPVQAMTVVFAVPDFAYGTPAWPTVIGQIPFAGKALVAGDCWADNEIGPSPIATECFTGQGPYAVDSLGNPLAPDVAAFTAAVTTGIMVGGLPYYQFNGVVTTGPVPEPWTTEIDVVMTDGAGAANVVYRLFAPLAANTAYPWKSVLFAQRTSGSGLTFTPTVVPLNLDAATTVSTHTPAALTVPVATVLAVSYTASTAAQLTVAYTGAAAVAGGTGPYTYSLAAGSLPNGLALNTATGAVTGTPSAVGSSSFVIAVVDAMGVPGSVAVTIVIVSASSGAPLPLNLVFSGGGGTVGVAYSAFVEALSGTGPYSYAVHSGALPTGVNLNTSTGALTGTPIAAGPFSFSIQVTDSMSATANLAIQVMIGGYGALTASFSGSHAQLGVAYVGAVTPSGGKPGYAYYVLTGAMAPGLALNGSSGAITGTPTSSGTWTFTVEVEDSLSALFNVSCVITVTAAQISVVGQITSVTASVSLTGVHNDQSTTAQIAIVPVWAAGTAGVQKVDIWAYYRAAAGAGLAWYWIQNNNVLVGGTTYITLPIVPGASYAGQIAVMAGSTNGDPAIALGAPPSLAQMSSGFTLGIIAPAATAVTGATVAAVTTVENADGVQNWAVPTISVPMPGNASPNLRYVSLTVQMVNALGTPAAASAGGVETEIDRFNNYPAAYTAVSAALNPGPGYQNRNAYGYHYARLKLYAVDFNATGWADVSGHSVLQTNPWGIGTANDDVNFGTAPAGQLDSTRLDPTTLGRYLANNISTANPGGNLTMPSDNIGHSVLPDWSFEYSTAGTLPNTALASPQSQWLSGAGSNAIRNDGGNSGANYLRMTGPNCSVWQSIAIVGASGVDGQACYFRLAVRSSNSGTGTSHQFNIGVVAFNSAGAVVNVNGNAQNNIVNTGYIASWSPNLGMILQMPATVARLQVLLQTSSSEIGYWDVDDVVVQPVTNQSAGGQNNSQVPVAQTPGNTALQAASTSTTATGNYGLSQILLTAADGTSLNLQCNVGGFGGTSVWLMSSGTNPAAILLAGVAAGGTPTISIQNGGSGAHLLQIGADGIQLFQGGVVPFTGTLAAAISAGKNVKNGTIY